jgi:hypothetical protein
MEESKAPVTEITPNQLAAISYLLYFYEQHLWHFAAPSVKRTRQITEIQFLLVKMQLLASTKIGTFTPDEFAYIDTAIRVFTTQAREKIPPSESRDQILADCEELCQYLLKTLTP